MNSDELLQSGLGLHQGGQLARAEGVYREVLASDAENVDGLHLLGLLLHQTGRHQESQEVLARALEIDPEIPEVHNVLGLAHAAQGRAAEAQACFGRALELDPGFADALINLSRLLHSQGKIDKALHMARRAIESDARNFDAQMQFGLLAMARRDLHSAGQAFLNATLLRPEDANAHYHLGIAYDKLSDGEAAAKCYRRAIELKPDYVEAHNNLGVIYHYQRRMGDAIRHHQAAIAIRPGHATAQANLGWDYWALGLVKEAITYYRKALEYDPNDYLTHSNLLMAMHYVEAYSGDEIFNEHVRWGERHARKFYPEAARVEVSRSRERIRVGYVSSNFREHAVSIFFEPIIRNHDHEGFEIFCYSDVPVADAVTERIKGHADHWHHTQMLTDEQLDALIRSHGLDILFDLNGHIADNRLMVFARKPAPIQVTYLGYPDTTGVATMDYRLTDDWQDPEGADGRAVEKLVRLPRSAWTYDPWAELEIGDVPAGRNGFVTFGSLNNLAKISPEMMEVWAGILKEVEGAKLALLVQADRFAEKYFVEKFAVMGIGRERLVFHTHRPHLEYLKLFGTLDVALDTFPYNGHTTTLNACWMGAAVVTLAGETHVARAGLGVLSTIGAGELVARSKDEYREIAVGLAKDRERLAMYRRTLRERMKGSALFDAKGFTRNLEIEYQQMVLRGRGG